MRHRRSRRRIVSRRAFSSRGSRRTRRSQPGRRIGFRM